MVPMAQMRDGVILKPQSSINNLASLSMVSEDTNTSPQQLCTCVVLSTLK